MICDVFENERLRSVHNENPSKKCAKSTLRFQLYLEWKVQYDVMCTRTQDLLHNLKYVGYINCSLMHIYRGSRRCVSFLSTFVEKMIEIIIERSMRMITECCPSLWVQGGRHTR